MGAWWRATMLAAAFTAAAFYWCRSRQLAMGLHNAKNGVLTWVSTVFAVNQQFRFLA